MSRPLPLAALAVALSAACSPLVHAQDTPPAAPTQPAPPAPGNGDDRPRRGGEMRGDGPREGGPRGGGPREGRGGPGGGMGQRPDETPEQYRARVLKPYLEMLPDLSADQQTHILAILDAANAEMNAARQDTALSEDRQRAAMRYVRGDIPNRIAVALTETQLATYTQLRAEQQAAMADMEKVGSVRPDEDIEQMRARLLQGYEDVMEELSVKQKTAVLKVLEDSAEEADAIKADTKRTDAEKLAALRQLHDAISAKVIPLLDADQAADWKKAHAAKRP